MKNLSDRRTLGVSNGQPFETSKANATTLPKRRIVGGTCQIGPFSSRSRTDVVALVSTAWSLMLSWQLDSREVDFAVNTSHARFSPHHIRPLIDRKRPFLEVKHEISKLESESTAKDVLLGKSAISDELPSGSWPSKTAIDFQPSNYDHGEAATSCYNLCIGCSINESLTEMSMVADFDEHAICHDLVELLLNDLEHVIWQMLQIQSYDIQLDDIEMIGPASRRAMVNLNRPMQSKLDSLAHNVICRQVAANPDSPAVHAWDGTYTYAELDFLSSKLARHLIDMGVKPDMIVPIFFEKSKFSIVAMLGIMKAGGAFLPLDPALPLARLQGMVDDVNASISISSPRNKGRLSPSIKEFVMDDRTLDRLAIGSPDSPELPPLDLNPDTALYVIFTSGSTGKPKGVVVTHTSFCSSAAGFNGAIHLTSPQRRVLHYASPGFDASIAETLSPLTQGGCICIPSESDRLNDLAKCIVDLNVNWAALTPSVARLISPEDVPQLQVLCLVGEALTRDLVDVWADKLVLLNGYGPTECTVLAVVSDPIVRGEGIIPLGKACNCAIWIATPDGNNIQPFNTIGEIIIEGPGVTRGYLGDEKKTAAVFGDAADFLRNTIFSTSRFYRTGDLGRMSVDGTIEYMGRKDSQVKINGQRIELEEIEHSLKSCLPDRLAAYEVVVEPLSLPNGNKTMLTAFIGPAEGPSTSLSASESLVIDETDAMGKQIIQASRELSQKLAQTLPTHMLPRAFLACRVIPRSSSGKTDRKRLRKAGNDRLLDDYERLQEQSVPSFDHFREFELPRGNWSRTPSDTTDDDHFESPTPSSQSEKSVLEVPWEGSSLSMSTQYMTSNERFLRSVWANILQLQEESILLSDDFFKLGGDSIGLIKIVAAYRRIGTQITVASITNVPVLKHMSQVCRPLASKEKNVSEEENVPFSLISQESVGILRQAAAEQCQTTVDRIEDLIPCTHTQEELMVANFMHPGASVGRFVFKLANHVNLDKLRQAWQKVWSTSPTLRTRSVHTTLAGPLQAVMKQPMPWIMAQSLSKYIEEDNRSPMTPGRALTRFGIVTEKNAPYFVWTMHHMLYDGWSIPLLCQRVNAIYHGELPEPQASFKDFVSYTLTVNRGKQSEYWGRLLQNVGPSTFPVKEMPDITCLAKTNWSNTLKLPQAAALRSFMGVTMSTIVQAAWAIMISHYSRTDDVLFGATISGRNAPVKGIDCIDGPTPSTLPIRLAVPADAQVIDFLHKVREHFSGLIPFEQTSLRTIRSISADTNRGCAFQNLLIIQAGAGWDENDEPLGKPNHQGEPVAVPLVCQAWIHSDRIEFDVSFDDALTTLDTVKRSVTAVQSIISQLLELPQNSAARLMDLESKLVPKNTMEDMSALTEDSRNNIQDLIFEVSRRQGKVPALRSSNELLSYEVLESLSSKLAYYLVSLGIGRGSVVPLYFEKSIWTVVSMLATLKSGAAFVLIDPTQHKDKLCAILSQIEPTMILTSVYQSQHMNFGIPLKQVIVDMASLQRLPAAGSSSPLPKVSPTDLAHLIFTSGSTGKPKGVMISHAAMASSAVAYGKALQLKQQTRVLQFSSYSFDASINETLVVLILGATVCVPSENERMQDLAGYMKRAMIEWAILTPSVARLLSATDVPTLETLDLGGEAPDETLLKEWNQAGVRVFNVYGPAEAAGTVLCQRYRDGLDARTIGSPMGCVPWIVDKDDCNKLLNDGETGELLIEGPILADGYFKDNRKTELAFVSNPEWASPSLCHSQSRRMYKTGDLCYKDLDGALVYVGRKDFQIKLHGQRIELGDIESNLSKVTQVKSCAVLYPAAGPLKKTLTAIVELRSAKGHFPNNIKNQLEAKVSSVMIPTRWVNVESLFPKTRQLPLNPSGKVDRRLLSTALEELSAEQANAICIAPSTESPKAATISSEITIQDGTAFTLAEKIHSLVSSQQNSAPAHGAPNQGKDERRFDDLYLHASGLDSLNMMSLMYFISQNFGMNVSLQLLMDKSMTIRKLAETVTEIQPSHSTTAADSQSFSSPDSCVDIMAEINRYDSMLCGVQPTERRKTVLLTGANGYVGTEILHQLLEHRLVGRVVAIVRGETSTIAKERTIAAAKRARWWTSLHEENLEVWSGDLSRTNLGLAPQHWNQLENGSIDIIIHNGASVHWTKSYKALEAANISSTACLLSIATRHPHIKMTYVTGGRGSSSIDETEKDVADELSTSDALGYCQTKFVAESLVKRAAARCNASRFSIVSPGLVVGTPDKGIANSDDYIWRLAAACIKIGQYNADQIHSWLQVSDVETLASIIIDSSLNPKCEDASGDIVTNATDGMSWNQFWQILSGLGYKIEGKPSSQWLTTVRGDIEQRQEAHPLWPLAHMLETHLMEEDSAAFDMQQSYVPLKLKVAIRRSAEFLAGIGFLPAMPGIPGQEQPDSNIHSAFSRSGL